jgi:FKBP-type peptidyl-prolyl cis-trans isomerase
MSKRPSLLTLAVLLPGALVGLTACGQEAKSASNGQSSQAASSSSLPSQGALTGSLSVVDEAVGTGPEAKRGDKVSVHYTGWLADGRQFDSSVGGRPFRFTLGAGEVIEGWDRGVAGMKVGGKRKLTIPPDLGYGSEGAGGVIPPNATLVFEVELLKIK